MYRCPDLLHPTLQLDGLSISFTLERSGYEPGHLIVTGYPVHGPEIPDWL